MGQVAEDQVFQMVVGVDRSGVMSRVEVQQALVIAYVKVADACFGYIEACEFLVLADVDFGHVGHFERQQDEFRASGSVDLV